MFSLFYFSSFVVKFDLFTPVNSVHCKLLLAHLESAYSLMWGAHNTWGQGDGEPLTLL